MEHCVDPCSVDIRKHIFPSFLLFFFFLFSKQMTNFRLFFSFEIVLEPNHKSSGEIKRPCKGFVKQHVSWGDLAELCKALQIQKVTIVTVYCCPHALLCLLPHRNWSKLRGRGHEGRLQSHTAGTFLPPQNHCPPLLHQHCCKAQLSVTSQLHSGSTVFSKVIPREGR